MERTEKRVAPNQNSEAIKSTYLSFDGGEYMTSNRQTIEHIIDQELSSILLQSIKLAKSEQKSAAQEVLQILAKVIEARRSAREGSTK